MLISDLSSEQLLMLIVPALPNMWALKHAMYHDFPTPKEKYRWMMACVFIPCLGGIAYYFVGRKHASREKVDIRARIEAERAARAQEAGVAAPLAESAVQDASAVSEAPAAPAEASAAVAESSAEPLSETSAASAEAAATAVEAPAALSEEADRESARPEERRAPEKTAPRGDDWSFGCPDDVRRS